MPPKNQKIDDEYSSSAAEEESQNSSASTEEESDSKQEPDSIANRKHNAPVSRPTTQRNESKCVSDEEEIEEFENENDESVSDSPIKPNTLKKPTINKSTNSASKRSLEFPKDDAKESKSNKKAKTSKENEKKARFTAVYDDGGNAIFRVWSWADEIALLEGAVDYINQTGSHPSANISDFYEFIKGDLFSGVSRNHVYVKLRRFKAMFFRLQGTGEDGGDPVFSNPFQYKAFELSKEIWGVWIQRYSEEFLAKYPNLSGSFDMEVGFLKDHVHLIGHTKAKKLERKWTKLRIEEMEVVTKKLSLMAGQIKLVLNAMKKG